MHNQIHGRGTRSPCRAGILLAVLAMAFSAAANTDKPPVDGLNAEREALVALARQGEPESALRALIALRNNFPDDAQLLIDTAIVAALAGDDARVLDLLGTLEPAAVPEHALSALAKSTRNLGRWDLALKRYDELILLDAGKVDYHLGRILTLADADRFRAANEELAAANVRFADSREAGAGLAIACGYVEERARRFTRALACYHQALVLEPDNVYAMRRRIMVASAIGAAENALIHARAAPGMLSADELLRLEIDAIAMELRWSYLDDPASSARQNSGVLNRLSALEAQRSEVLADLAQPTARAYHFDRVAALAAAYRMKEAIELFESLERELALAADIPAYAYSAAGQAYLFEDLHEKAERCYLEALRRKPDSFNELVGLFYALSDQLRTEEARQIAQQLLDSEPVWLRPTETIWLQNRRYAQARQIVAMDKAYRHQYGNALLSLDEMLAIAPANVSVRVSRAQVLSWRGWYDRAEKELAIAERSDPGNANTAVVSGHVALDAQRFSDAESSLDTALAAAPQEKATVLLEQRWRLHNSPELAVRAEASRSDGSTFGSDSWQIDSHYFTRPFGRHYRAYVHDTIRYATLDEGAGRDHRVGAGMEYRDHRLSAHGEIYRGLQQNTDTGAAANVDWNVTDHVGIEVSAAVNTMDIPLRAVHAGITADSVGGAATYRWHEARSLAANTGFVNFDDGNRRRSFGADFGWNAIDAPRNRLLVGISGDTSSNTRIDAPYFNPRRDRTLSLSLTHEWLRHRHSGRVFRQSLGVEVGSYWQKNFGAGNVWEFRIEHAWSLGARLEVGYGISTGRRPYDGDQEQTNTAFFRMEGRL